MELFHDAFGLLLVPDSPYTAAAHTLGEVEAEALLDLQPTRFTDAQE
jgi:hypothetical protein